jgi:hypothetical protein
MQFHQDTVERIRDSIFKIMIDKNMVREGLTFDDLVKDFPQFYDNNNDDDTSEDEYSDVPQVKEEVFNDNIQDDNIQGDNIQGDNTSNNTEEPIVKKVKKEKKKKEKKEKKEVDPNKPKKKPNAFIVFKTHADNQELISQKANDIDEESGKPYGKVKAAGILWKELSEEQREEWKNKSSE